MSRPTQKGVNPDEYPRVVRIETPPTEVTLNLATGERSGRMTTEADEYSQDELQDIARKYLRDNENREYRRMARRGELDEDLEKTANRTHEFAHRLIASGTAVPQAWSWAIRVVILKSEMD